MSNLEASIDLVVEQLIRNARFPKYQLERASEPLLAPFLLQWISAVVGRSMSLAAMELPIKKKDNNQSTNADYLLIDETGRWYIVEVKTGRSELPDAQLYAYLQAKNDGASKIVTDLAAIEEATKSRWKYRELRACLPRPPSDMLVEIILITPDETRPIKLEGCFAEFHWLPLSGLFAHEPREHRELWQFVKKLRPALLGES